MSNPHQGQRSVRFDRAVGFYDRTRGFPPGVDQKVAAGLCRLAGLGRGDRVLELGVGTGRIALPLAKRGLEVVGIDLSRPMLEALRRKEGPFPVRIVEGDVVALPFREATFAAVLAVHVLHLVSGWRTALLEAVRVLRPGGAFLLGWTDREESSPAVQVRNRWREIVGQMGGDTSRPGEGDEQRLAAALEELGLVREAERDVVTWRVRGSAADAVRDIAERIFSDSWGVAEEVHRASLERLQEWVQGRYADPEASWESSQSFRLVVLRHAGQERAKEEWRP